MIGRFKKEGYTILNKAWIENLPEVRFVSWMTKNEMFKVTTKTDYTRVSTLRLLISRYESLSDSIISQFYLIIIRNKEIWPDVTFFANPLSNKKLSSRLKKIKKTKVIAKAVAQDNQITNVSTIVLPCTYRISLPNITNPFTSKSFIYIYRQVQLLQEQWTDFCFGSKEKSIKESSDEIYET